MTYKQLFLLVLTIWSAELFTRFLFDVVMEPQMSVEFRTVYIGKDAEKDVFMGSSLKDYGSRGWRLVAVQPDPDNRNQLIVFMQRRTALRLGTTDRE